MKNNDNPLLERQTDLAASRQNSAEPGSPCEKCKAPACPMVCRPRNRFEVGNYLRKTKQGGYDKK